MITQDFKAATSLHFEALILLSSSWFVISCMRSASVAYRQAHTQIFPCKVKLSQSSRADMHFVSMPEAYTISSLRSALLDLVLGL